MLFPAEQLDRIVSGEVRAVFRHWRRPQAKDGNQMRTPRGVLLVEAVDAVDPEDLTADDATAAGFASLDALLHDLALWKREETALYRISLRFAGDDPRVTLREQGDLTEAEFAALRRRLDRMDATSANGPWTRVVLELVRDNEGVLAATLAGRLDARY